jgi:hypothetical protein
MLMTNGDLLAIIIALLGLTVALAYQFIFIRRLTEENEMLWEKLTDLIKEKNK